METKRKINSLQVLRFIMFIFIFIHHMTGYFGIKEYGRAATAAVDFFFILSGFVLYYSYENKLDSIKCNIKNCLTFAIKKLKKFYVFYFITLFLTLPITLIRFYEIYEFTFKFILKIFLSFLANIFLIQVWIPNGFYFANFNGPAWFLSACLFLYLLTIPLMKIIKKISDKKLLLLLLIGLLVGKYFYMQIPNAYWTYYSPIGRVFEFMLGMVLCNIMQKISLKIENNFYVKTIFSILELLTVYNIYKYFLVSSTHNSNIYILMLLMLLTIFIFSFEKGVISKLMNNKCLVSLGNRSDKFYLFHVISIWYIGGILKVMNPNANKYIMIMVLLLITIIFSIVLEEIIKSIGNHGIKGGFNDLINKLKKVYFKYTGKIKQRRFKNKDFTIISNNCFGGIVYRDNNLEYRTPTAGLFFMASDYIKFIYNLDHYLNTEVIEISKEESRYEKYLNDIEYNSPIGKIDDIEVMFLHYSTFKEAKEKWDRRKKRINKEKIIYKFSDQNLCSYEDLKKFDEFKADNKICFTAKKYTDLNTIQMKQYENNDYVLHDSNSRDYKRVLNIYDYINNINNIKNKKIRILTLVADLDKCNGISSYVMNYYQHLDLNKFQMDFIVTGKEICKEYEKIILSNGGTIFRNNKPTIKHMIRDINSIKNFIKEHNNYDIIHSHLVNIGYYYLKYAKRYGIKVRIEHSHTVIPREKNIIRDFRNQLFSKLVVRKANTYFACSEIAGKSLFNKRNFTVIHNAIYVQDYIFNENIRKEYRNEMNLNDKIVIGHVGRFDNVKNQDFILSIFKEISKKNSNYYLLLIGDGVNRENIEARIKKEKISNVSILGVRDDVSSLLQAMDIFVLPSSFEGLGLVAVEAQTSDLECLLSTNVPSEVKIIKKVKFLNLDSKEWIKNILNIKTFKRINNIEKVSKSNFNVEVEIKRLEDIYIKIVQGR